MTNLSKYGIPTPPVVTHKRLFGTDEYFIGIKEDKFIDISLFDNHNWLKTSSKYEINGEYHIFRELITERFSYRKGYASILIQYVVNELKWKLSLEPNEVLTDSFRNFICKLVKNNKVAILDSSNLEKLSYEELVRRLEVQNSDYGFIIEKEIE